MELTLPHPSHVKFQGIKLHSPVALLGRKVMKQNRSCINESVVSSYSLWRGAANNPGPYKLCKLHNTMNIKMRLFLCYATAFINPRLEKQIDQFLFPIPTEASGKSSASEKKGQSSGPLRALRSVPNIRTWTKEKRANTRCPVNCFHSVILFIYISAKITFL